MFRLGHRGAGDIAAADRLPVAASPRRLIWEKNAWLAGSAGEAA